MIQYRKEELIQCAYMIDREYRSIMEGDSEEGALLRFATASIQMALQFLSDADKRIGSKAMPTACEHEWHVFGTFNSAPDVACQKCGETRPRPY